MKRLNFLAALAAATTLFSVNAGADDRDYRDRDRDHYSRSDRHHDRSERRDRRWEDRRWDDRRWDDRRYIHARPNRYWMPPGHRYSHGYRDGYWDSHYYGSYYGNYYGSGYYPPRYRRSGIDGTLILTFPLW